MKFQYLIFLLLFVVLATPVFAQYATQDSVHFAGEKYFKNVRQLTFGGDNAEAYWSYDGKSIVFQKTNPKEGVFCDQIFVAKVPVTDAQKFTPKMIGTGKGRSTCAYFLPDGKHIIYASTHLGADTCPPVPDRAKYGNKYIWPLYNSYDIFMADMSGKIVKQITSAKGYDAEATVSPDGKTKIVWRASRPKTPEAIKEYKELLAEGMVAPTNMEVFVANADGSNAKQITALGQANWAPNFTPDGKHIIFCSNHEYKRGFPFNMYLIDLEGKGLEKISRDKGFDAFPMFSPDGKKIIFASNRNNGGTRDTNLFVADWVE